MEREEFIKKMKEIDPSYVPFEELSKEEQAEAYDRMFDWEEDD